MKVNAEKLQLFAMLLGTPKDGSLELLEALAAEYPWLHPSLSELDFVPLEQWQGEHTALFVNGFPHTVAPPFLTALRHGQMGGDIEEELRDLYYRYGLVTDSMPADYLGTLFECASWLFQEEKRHPGGFDELWDNYLYPILPDFANRLINRDGLLLYTEMGRQLSHLYWHNGPELAMAE